MARGPTLRAFMYKMHLFDNRDALALALSARLEQEIKRAKALFVSGGRTPKKLFEALSHNKRIDWSTVTLAATDERWVPSAHDASNARFIRQNLMQNAARKAHLFAYYQQDLSLEDAAHKHEARVAKLLALKPPMVLGMGEDGHTASLFPNIDPSYLSTAQAMLDFKAQRLLGSTEPQNAPYARLSLSAAAIAQAKPLYLHIEGSQKQKIFNAALKVQDYNTCPVAAFIQHPTLYLKIYYSP